MIPLRDTIPSRGTPVVTWALIAVNAIVFLCELVVGPEDLERWVYFLGMVPARYSHPDWARGIGFPIDHYASFVTSMFLHGGWMHLIGNMWTLWIFGDNVEERMGRGRFLAFYLFCGLAAGLTHWLTNIDSTVPTIGASGAIAGVLGAYFVLYPRANIIVLFPVLFVPFFFELPAIVYLALWFLSQVTSGTLSGLGPENVEGIAWWAHVGGFLAGAALHRLFIVPRRGYEGDEYDIEGAWGRRG
jgi:membrane associated rhomboid family serine protease